MWISRVPDKLTVIHSHSVRQPDRFVLSNVSQVQDIQIVDKTVFQ